MLYDPKWDQKTKADPFTLEDVIAWLERQDPDQRYDYDNCFGECLFGQYAASVGVPWERAGAGSCWRGGDAHGEFRRFIYNKVARPTPWTYGAALDRARARAAMTSQERQ